jgi:hypothetical protein
LQYYINTKYLVQSAQRHVESEKATAKVEIKATDVKIRENNYMEREKKMVANDLLAGI